MKRAKPIQRKTRLKSVNRERAAKRKARDFGEYADWIRAQPCVMCLKYQWPQVERPGILPWIAQNGITQAAHSKSRGAGGTARHLIPLCTGHHMEQHQWGIRTFEKRHEVDLGAIAADLWGRYQRETKGDAAW